MTRSRLGLHPRDRGLIRFTGERVIPTEKARALYSKIQEIRIRQITVPTRRVTVVKGLHVLWRAAPRRLRGIRITPQALSREYAMRPMGLAVTVGVLAIISLRATERRRRNSGHVRAGYGGAQEKKVQEEPIEHEQGGDTEEICRGRMDQALVHGVESSPTMRISLRAEEVDDNEERVTRYRFNVSTRTTHTGWMSTE